MNLGNFFAELKRRQRLPQRAENASRDARRVDGRAAARA